MQSIICIIITIVITITNYYYLLFVMKNMFTDFHPRTLWKPTDTTLSETRTSRLRSNKNTFSDQNFSAIFFRRTRNTISHISCITNASKFRKNRKHIERETRYTIAIATADLLRRRTNAQLHYCNVLNVEGFAIDMCVYLCVTFVLIFRYFFFGYFSRKR